jgi:hypothetical protein
LTIKANGGLKERGAGKERGYQSDFYLAAHWQNGGGSYGKKVVINSGQLLVDAEGWFGVLYTAQTPRTTGRT